MRLIRSFRAQLTALYLAFFSLLFLLFSIFLYGELSRALVAHLDDTLASEVDTAAVLFPDEFQEMKGDVMAAAQGSSRRNEGARRLSDHPRRQPHSGRQPAIRAGSARPQRHTHGPGRRAHLRDRALRVARYHPCRVGRGPPRHLYCPAADSRARRAGRIRARHAQFAPSRRMAEQAHRITGSNLETRIKIDNAAEELAVLVTSFNQLLARLDQSFDNHAALRGRRLARIAHARLGHPRRGRRGALAGAQPRRISRIARRRSG